ncbi:TonB-dependent siderophore receptor [Phenylobacterium sp.]|uniref:TonB-dependent receptor n=1 Tax=Phenylobacterium sp. TaxID=1871053 RepID=UPI0025F61B55|nr:TonB-dependent siderophore receptor [Phenylobacterium sp.]MBX3483657.1 TonB-dependent siderophore receptor [Phenylobacterium sp.]
MKSSKGVVARKTRALTFAAAGLAGLSLGGAACAADGGDAAADAAMATADQDQAGTVTSVEVQGQILKQNNPKVTADPLNNPQTVTVISRGTIAAQNLLSLRDILSTVPGITFGAGEGGGGFGDSINLRGYSANNDITVDNVRDSAQYSRSDPFNLEQIEVTNGANSVQQGSGSVGGTINIVSKRPTRRNSTTVSAGVGTDNYYRGTIDANHAINDSIAVRLNVMAHRNDAPGRDVEKFKRFGIAPAITIGLNGPTQFTALYLHQEDRNTPQYGVPYYNGGAVPGVDPSDYFGYSNIDKQRQQVDVFTGIIDHDFGNGLKVRNLSRYQRVTQLTVVDPPQGVYCLANGQKAVGFSQTTTATNITGYTACLATDPAPGFYAPSGPRGNLRNSKNTLLYNQTDFTWDGEFAGMQHTLVAGFSFTEEDFRLDTGNLFRNPNGSTVALAPINIANPNNIYTGPINYIRGSIQNGNRKNQAVYLFDNIQLNEQFSINGGLRWEHNEGVNSTDAYSTVVGPTLGVVTPGIENRSDDNLLTYRIGLVYKPIPNASLYIAYGNSETPSQATVNGSGACNAATNCTVDPEKAENFEVGAKWDIDGRLSLTGALFRNKRSNYRVASNDPTIPVQQLDGTARVDGVALGVTGKVTEQWSVFANYTYLNSKVIQGVDDFAANLGRDFTKGDDLLQVPNHAFSLFTTYDVPEWKLQFGYGVTYQGEAYLTQHGQITNSNPPARTTIPLVKSDDYFVHRITVAWYPTDTLEVRLNVNNVLDKEYYIRIRNNGWATPGDTRNATLTANYRF